MIPSKTRFTGLSFAGGQLSLPSDLKGTQAILRAKTPAFSSKKQSLPGNYPGRDFCHVVRSGMIYPLMLVMNIVFLAIVALMAHICSSKLDTAEIIKGKE